MLMSGQVAAVLEDLLDTCATIREGQEVLILAVVDGLHGGPNVVDETVVGWLHDGVLERKAHPSVLWIDLPERPHDWRIPPVVKGALANADVFISHAYDLPNEELLELRDILIERHIPMIRNMATTAPLFASTWARTPYELVSEIRTRTGSRLAAGMPWSIRSPLGTKLRGVIGPPLPPFKHYGESRREGIYRPFPEGVLMPVRTGGAEGILIFDRTGPWWARYIGVPPHFSQPVRIEIESNRIVGFAGGDEAKALERFYRSMEGRFGESVYEIAGLHGGVHPHAVLSPHECLDPSYREFIEHHQAGCIHLHLGHVDRTPEYPYMWHITAELKGVTWTVGEETICDRGRLAALDLPETGAVAQRYPGRPGIPPGMLANGRNMP